MNVFTLTAQLLLNTSGFDSSLGNAEQRLKGIGQKSAQAGNALNSLFGPLQKLGKDMIQTSIDFEKGMDNVLAITGANEKQFESLRDKAIELGASTKFSAVEAADAMSFLAMAGFDTDKILGSMEGTLQLAAAGNLDLAKSADIVSNIMSGYGMETDRLNHAVDVLAKTFTSTNTDLTQLGVAFKYAGPVAKSAGLSFEETAAAIGLMGNAGIQASMAGTALRGTVTRLLTPTEAMQGVINKLGLDVIDATTGGLIPMVEIVQQLEMSGASTSDMMTLFGQRAGPAMLALVSQGSGALADLTTELEGAGGTAGDIADKQLDNLQGAITLMQSAWSSVAIQLGEFVIPILTELANSLTDVLGWFANLPDPVQKFVLSLAAVLGGAGPVLIIIGQIAAALGALAGSPILLVIGALSALAVAFANNFGGIQESVKTFIDNNRRNFEILAINLRAIWREIIKPTVEAFAPAFQAAFAVIGIVLQTFIDTLNNVVEFILALKDGQFRLAAEIFFEAGKDMIRGLINGVKAMWTGAKETVTNLGKNIISWFKNAVGSNSPWQTAIQEGINMIKGFILGVSDAAVRAELEAELNRLGEEMVSATLDPYWKGLDELNLRAQFLGTPLENLQAQLGLTKTAFDDLIKMSLADGVVSDEERALLQQFADDIDLLESKIAALSKTVKDAPNIPANILGDLGQNYTAPKAGFPGWTTNPNDVMGEFSGLDSSFKSTIFKKHLASEGNAFIDTLDNLRQGFTNTFAIIERLNQESGNLTDLISQPLMTELQRLEANAGLLTDLISQPLMTNMQRLEVQAGSLSDLISQPVTNAYQENIDNLNRLKQEAGSLTDLITGPVTQGFEWVENIVVNHLAPAFEFAASLSEYLSQQFGAFAGGLYDFATTKIPFLGKAFTDGLKDVTDDAGEVIGVALDPISMLSSLFFQLVAETEVFKTLISLVSKVLKPLVDIINVSLMPTLSILEPALNLLAKVMTGVSFVVASIWNAIANAVNFVLGWLGVHLNTIDINEMIYPGGIDAGVDWNDQPDTGGGYKPDPKPKQTFDGFSNTTTQLPSGSTGVQIAIPGLTEAFMANLMAPLPKIEMNTATMSQALTGDLSSSMQNFFNRYEVLTTKLVSKVERMDQYLRKNSDYPALKGV